MMQDLCKAKIFLAENRGKLETEWMRCCMTFNFGNYKNNDKEPFGNLQVFNEDTLAAGHSLTMQLEEDTEVIILPIVGTLEYKDDIVNEVFVEAEQMQLFSATKGMKYSITNPFKKDELINFLQIWLNKAKTNFISKTKTIFFDINETNQLIPLFIPCQINQTSFGYIGKYTNRTRDNYCIKVKGNGVYFFVIEGIIEVKERLLNTKDGIAIFDTESISFEVFSNSAILLLLEIPLY